MMGETQTNKMGAANRRWSNQTPDAPSNLKAKAPADNHHWGYLILTDTFSATDLSTVSAPRKTAYEIQ